MSSPNLDDLYAKDGKIDASGDQGGQQQSANGQQAAPTGDQGGQQPKFDVKSLQGNDPLAQQHIPGVDNTNPKAVADYLANKDKGAAATDDKGQQQAAATDDKGQQAAAAPTGEFQLPENFITDFNKKAGTDFKSIDDVYGELASVKSLRESELSLKNTIANNKNPFEGDEDLAKVYQFRKETNLGFDEFNMINGKNIGEMDSIDALVLQQVLDNPEYKGKEDLVRESLVRQYKMDDEDLEDREKEINQMHVDIAAKKAKESLTTLQSKITVPDFSGNAQITEEMKLQQVEDDKMWADTVPGIADSFSKFPVYASNKDMTDGNEPFTHIEIPADARSEYAKVLGEYVRENNIAPTKENVEKLNNMMHQDYISKNYLNIANAYASKKIEENNAMWSERSGQSINKMKEQFNSSNTGTRNKVEDFNKSEVDRVLKNIPGR